MDEIYANKIFELKEQGYSYAKIFDYFEKNGIDLDKKEIVQICRRMYKERNRNVPKPKRDNNQDIIELPLQEVLDLRRSGKTYEEIAQYYRDKGIEVSRESIRKRIKDVGALQGIGKIRIENLPIDEIMYLKEKKGLTYNEIVDYYKNKGIKLKKNAVMLECRGKLKAKNKNAKFGVNLNRRVDKETVYQLKKMGLTYKQIVAIYEFRGISVSVQTIERRCAQAFKEKGEQVPQMKKKKREDKKTEQELRELNESLDALLSEKKQSEDLLKGYTELLSKQEKGEKYER